MVAPAKAAARDAARRAVERYEGTARLALRVNPVRSPWCNRDLEMAAACGPTLESVVVPKVESAADLEFVDRLLAGAEAESGRERPLLVQALLATAAGLEAATEIARACPRMCALILGYADLATSLGRAAGPARDPQSWRCAQETLLVGARVGTRGCARGPSPPSGGLSPPRC